MRADTRSHAGAQVVGPHVRLSAVTWLDRVTIFPLTPLLNLLPAHPVTDCLLMPVRTRGTKQQASEGAWGHMRLFSFPCLC